MGVNSVPSTVSPCSTHCLPSCQWTTVCVCVCVCIPPLLYALAEVCSSAWGSVCLEDMRTSFSQYISIGWGVMHCDWFVQLCMG